jgi:hypothetical protein
MTNDEIPNDEGNPKLEFPGAALGAVRAGCCGIPSLGIRHSFVIGYFVIRHFHPSIEGNLALQD